MKALPLLLLIIITVDQSKLPSFSVGNMIQDNAAPQYYPAESQIWNLAADGTITAQWTNADRTVPARVMYNAAGGGVGLVYLLEDLGKLKATYGSLLNVLR
jgi:hypothetical protein